MFINYNPEFDISMTITQSNTRCLTIDSYSYDCLAIYTLYKNGVYFVFKIDNGYYTSRTFAL